MLPLSLILSGYLLLPLGFFLLDRAGPTGLVSAFSALLVGLSLTVAVYTFVRRQLFLYTLPLLGFSLFHLGSVLFIKLV